MTYVALLRGINVGNAKRIAMAELRTLVEGLGYEGVRTLLNSGNVVFTGPKKAPRTIREGIEKAVEAIGVPARVIVLTADELAGVVAANPLLDIADNHSRLLVGILNDIPDRSRLTEILAADWGEERIALGASRAVYMWMPRGVIESRLNAAFARALADRVTARNWATMLKLKAMTEKG